MSFVRLQTSDGDTRFVNLDQVSRVTIGTDENGVELLVAVFADGNVEDSLRIRATDDTNHEAILEFQRILNHHCESD